MKATKLLPILAVVLCVPGIALRALHLLNGFDVSTGLPTAGDKWIWFVIALFAIALYMLCWRCRLRRAIRYRLSSCSARKRRCSAWRLSLRD
ncbi:MAG: hypothetical protein ACLRVN_04275 [Butyricicoccus sp.]